MGKSEVLNKKKTAQEKAGEDKKSQSKTVNYFQRELENLEKDLKQSSDKSNHLISKLDRHSKRPPFERSLWKEYRSEILVVAAVIVFALGLGLFLMQWAVHQTVNERLTHFNLEEQMKVTVDAKARELMAEELRPQIDKARAAVDQRLTGVLTSFNDSERKIQSYLTDARERLLSQYGILDAQLVVLADQKRVLDLSIEAIENGNVQAYKQLMRFQRHKIVGSIAKAEVLRIRAFYAEANRVAEESVTFEGPLGIEYVDESIPTHALIDDLTMIQPDWRSRAKSAELLAQHPVTGVPEVLLKTMAKDDRLDVVANSMRSFLALTGFEPGHMLDSESAEEWWNENSDRVNAGLKAPEEIKPPVEPKPE